VICRKWGQIRYLNDFSSCQPLKHRQRAGQALAS
jgi:hypothetical protein